MPTPLTDAINALTTYANETTGAGDTTLSEAVATLIEGYGQGGGSSDKWQRPSDWPDLSKMNRSTEVLYITCQADHDTSYIDFRLRTSDSSKYNLEIGHIVGNNFVADESYETTQNTQARHLIGVDSSGYKVCKLTPIGSSHFTDFAVNTSENPIVIDGKIVTGQWSSVLEIYGNLPYIQYNCSPRTCKYLQSFDVTNVAPKGNVSYAFAYCSNLKSVDMSTWDMSAVTNMDSYFRGCPIEYLKGYETLNVGNVTNFSRAFDSVKLETIDLSRWDMHSATNLSYMFYSTRANRIILGTRDLSRVTTYQSMYDGSWVRDVDISNVTTSSNAVTTTNMFINVRNIVKLTMPSTLVAIGNSTFSGMNGTMEFHFLSTTPPTLNNTNAFPSMAVSGTNRVIYVPYSEDHSILEAYQTANNWSNFASYIQEEPQG